MGSVRAKYCLVILSGIIASFPESPCQSPTAQVTAPSESNKFMQSAADATSITAADVKPWHLKARYQEFKPDGSMSNEGVFEEWWAGPQKSKLVFSGSGSNQAFYRTAGDTLTTGKGQWPLSKEVFVSELLLHPLPTSMRMVGENFASKDVVVGGSQLECLLDSFAARGQAPLKTAMLYCFSMPGTILRVIQEPSGAQTAFNGITRVGRHYLARQIRRTDASGKPMLTVDVETLDAGPGAEDPALAPPADAVSTRLMDAVACENLWHQKTSHDKVDYLKSSIAMPVFLQGSAPSFPDPEGLLIRDSGEVRVSGLVTKDGSFTHLTTSGPKLLQTKPLEALRDWKFSPGMLGGQPIETPICVIVSYANQ